MYTNGGEKKEQQTGITHKRHHTEEVWGNFYLSEDGWCLLASAGNRSHAGLRFSPHSGWYTLDRENKQLGEEKFSLSLYFSLSLILRLRDSQSDRGFLAWAYRRWMWQNVNVCARRLKRTWSEVMELFSRRVLKSSVRGEKTMQSQCTLTTDWGPTKMSECTVWRSATCLWRETATLSCASLF